MARASPCRPRTDSATGRSCPVPRACQSRRSGNRLAPWHSPQLRLERSPAGTEFSRPVLPEHLVREITLLEVTLPLAVLAVRSSARVGVRAGAAARHEILPGGDPPPLELLQEVPQRRPRHVMGEGRVPGDGNAEGQVLVEAEIARQLPLHER